jgi:hypothetical protein
LGHGDKLHLMLKESKSATTAKKPSSVQSCTPAAAAVRAAVIVAPNLEEELVKALSNHFRTEDETKKVARAFKRVRMTVFWGVNSPKSSKVLSNVSRYVSEIRV